jgi:pSer/pThr/pTyr-binding forkhead associated (FHA) protein
MYKLSYLKEDGEKIEYQLEEEELLIGRDKKNAVFLDDKSISRKHAKITLKEDKLFIEDLGSKNGVVINEAKIKVKTELNAGDIIKIGIIKLTLEKEVQEEDDQKTVMVKVEEAKAVVEEEAPVEEEAKTMVDMKAVEVEDSSKTVIAGIKDMEMIQYAKLLGISEDVRGKEYILDKSENKIGRTPDNEISIKHNSISKNHALIVCDESSCYIIKDLESKNGTKVNGKLVEDISLNPGDTIEFGNVKFRFVGKGEIVSLEELEAPSPLPRKRIEKELINKILNKKTVGILAVLILLFFIITVVNKKKKESEKEKAELALVKQEEDKTKKLINNYLSSAKDFTESRQWEKVILNSNMILALVPDNEEAIKYKELAQFELKNKKQFDLAMSFFNEGSYQEAIKQFNLIDENSSTYFLESKQWILESEEKMEIKQKEMEVAKEKDLAMKKDKELKGEEVRAESIIIAGKKAYIKGNIGTAKKELQKIDDLNLPQDSIYKKEYKKLSARMDKVKKLYGSGLSHYKKGWYKSALKDWNPMLNLDKKIVGKRSSYYSKKVGPLIADIYYKRGDEAYNKNDLKGAYQQWAKALNVMPGHKESKNGIAKLSKKAKALYQEGYVLENTDFTAAMKKWNAILKIVPPYNEYYKKAKKKLKKYQ